MTGKLKTKGNVMLATKLDGVLGVSLYFSAVVRHQSDHPSIKVAKAKKAKL